MWGKQTEKLKKPKELKQNTRLLSFNKIDKGCVLDYKKQKGI